MDYRYLTDADRESLRRSRILQLEGDHYRLELVIAETSDPDRRAQLIDQQVAIKAAIAAHAGEEETTDRVETAVDVR
jgi:hypothetical protein